MTERKATLQARDRLAFLLALVPYLIDQNRVTVTEAAEHFHVAPHVIRDAVRLIALSGIPGETHSYQHEDLFDIAWDAFEEHDEIVLTHLVAIDDSPRFSAREAAALIAGLQYLSALPENSERDVIAQLMAKLSRGASSHPSELGVAANSTDATIGIIHASVAAGKQLEFNYRNSRGDHESRRVDPLRVESIDRDWYLRGWDHLRQAVRTFRLDRMNEVITTDNPISEVAASIRVPETLFEPSSDDLMVDIEIVASALPLVLDWVPEDAPRVQTAGLLKVSVRVAHYHGLKRLAAQNSGILRIIGPSQARQAVAEWAQAGANQYTAEL
jgi:proteasome accessory factor C